MLGMKAEDKVLVCILFELETHNRATGITRFSQFPLLKMLYKLNHHLLPFLLGGKAYRSIDQGLTVHPPSQKNSFDAKLLLVVKDGVFVAQAAGNEGLMPKSIMSYSPWIRFVAAAIDVRRYRHNLTLENGKNAPHVWLEYFKMLKAWLQLSYLDEGQSPTICFKVYYLKPVKELTYQRIDTPLTVVALHPLFIELVKCCELKDTRHPSTIEGGNLLYDNMWMALREFSLLDGVGADYFANNDLENNFTISDVGTDE
ncbi:subtilisin-like protease SBT2.6 [Tanacetum coccineum]